MYMFFSVLPAGFDIYDLIGLSACKDVRDLSMLSVGFLLLLCSLAIPLGFTIFSEIFAYLIQPVRCVGFK